MGSRMLTFCSLLVLTTNLATGAKFNRCYSCRSRGELGDCKDPFFVASNNSTTNAVLASKVAGVETPPCASGWCSKIIEGGDKTFKDAEYGAATQRDCLQRPPSDGEERCAFLKWNHKQVFMCFCRGDLCNNANNIKNNNFMLIFGLISLFFYLL